MSVTDFVSRLEKHPQAAAWGENPLLFSLAAMVFVQTGHLPSSRTTLYREVIEAVLKMREQDSMWCKLLLRLLAELALWLHQTKGRTFTSDDLLTFLTDVKRRPLNEAADLANRVIASGILEIVARETYGFKHQTFQEYLAAVELARRLTSQDTATQQEAWTLAWSKRTYSRWTEVLRLMVGTLAQEAGVRGVSEAQRWLSGLLEQRVTRDGDPGNLGLKLALKSLSEMTETSEWDQAKIAQLEKEIVSTWIAELVDATRHRHNTMKKRLVNLAHEVGHLSGNSVNVAVKLLEAALGDLNRNVRSAALEVLGELEEQAPLELLLAAFQDENQFVRSAAVEALGKLGERVPLEPLLAALQDDDQFVRSAAGQTLGKLGERVPLELLVPMLGDENRDVRLGSIQALKKRSPEILLTILPEATAILQRKPADKILGSLAHGFIAEVIGEIEYTSPVLLEKLIQLLDWPYWEVRVKAAQALGKLRRNIPDSGIRRLLELRGDHDPRMRTTREAADDALTEILSLETGIEDD